MRILYGASDIALSSNHGGAVHVREVAGGLADLGHAVRAVVNGRSGEPTRSVEHGFDVRRVLRGAPARQLRFLAFPAVAGEVRTFRPDAIIERYYEFGGQAVVCGKRRGIPVILEVNSPLVEYPGSSKERLDRLLGSSLRRWRECLARSVAAFVTPSTAILPGFVPREKVHEIPWGANTERFRPDVTRAHLATSRGSRGRRVRRQFSSWYGRVSTAFSIRRATLPHSPRPSHVSWNRRNDRPHLAGPRAYTWSRNSPGASTVTAW